MRTLGSRRRGLCVESDLLASWGYALYAISDEAGTVWT
jgi:hypothetical protein